MTPSRPVRVLLYVAIIVGMALQWSTIISFVGITPRFKQLWQPFLMDHMQVVLLCVAVLFVLVEIASIPRVWAFFSRPRRIMALKIITLLFLAIAALATYGSFTSGDSREHMHAAYLISQGQRPYIDFFEVHTPLWWYTISPLFLLIRSSLIVPVINTILLGIIMASLAVIFRIGLELSGDDEMAWIAVMLTVSAKWWLNGFIVMTPDPLMALFFVSSLLFFVRYLKHGTMWSLFFAGILQGMAIVTVQKNGPLMMLLALMILARHLRSGITIGSVRNATVDAAIFSLASVAPFVVLLTYIAVFQGAAGWNAFWAMNVGFNAVLAQEYKMNFLIAALATVTGFLQVCVLSVVAFIKGGGQHVQRWVLTWFVIGDIVAFLATIFVLNYYAHDLYMLYLPLLAVIGAMGLSWLIGRLHQQGNLYLGAIVFIVILAPNLLWLPLLSPTVDTDEIDFYLEHYDGERSFSNFVYNPDVSWEWFRPYEYGKQATEFMMAQGFSVYTWNDDQLASRTNIVKNEDVRNMTAFTNQGFVQCTPTILCRTV